jgi:hypothetical protein
MRKKVHESIPREAEAFKAPFNAGKDRWLINRFRIELAAPPLIAAISSFRHPGIEAIHKIEELKVSLSP